jgi:tripartite-type tricarboxylate transporter receptor subunit TctC
MLDCDWSSDVCSSDLDVVTQHIPYKGLGQQVTDTIGGQVEFGVMPLGVAAPLIKSGKLRALGVTGTARSPLLPQVPTLIEAGLRSCVYEPWLALIGPANLAPAQVQGLYAEIHKALEQKELHALMEAQDLSPISMSPAETAAYFQSESAKYAALARYAGARVE